MKVLIGMITGTLIMFSMSVSAGQSAESTPVGPFVQCQLPDKSIEFMPAFFCELKKGKYHY
jgi:hypothetical protein